MDGVIGVVTCFAGAAIPKNWLPCNGQQLQITPTYEPLFDIIGNAFGGDGKTTFNLPDLRGYTPVAPGSNGMGKYKLGANAGSETITVGPGQIPQHTHTGTVIVSMAANSADGIDASSNHGTPSRFTGAYNPTANCVMAKPSTYPSVLVAGTEPVNVCSPFLVLNYIICYAGIFPTRN